MKKSFWVVGCIFLYSFILQAGGRQHSFSVLTYNVENLFDWTHDEGKEDFTYLPRQVKRANRGISDFCRSMRNPFYRGQCFNLDWTPEVVQTKIAAIAAMIRAAQSQGPDILVLQEVENLNVLRMLVEWELGDLGYQTVELLEGPDRRGIDVAVVSKFPLVTASQMHPVYLPGKDPRPTRGILQVNLNVYGQEVVVFANHWPSLANPEEFRIAAARSLQEASSKLKNGYVLAAGDFNTASGSENTAFAQITTHPDNPQRYIDSRNLVRIYADNPVAGTHWYRGKWDYLDKILIHNSSLQGDRALVPSYLRIVSPSFALEHTGKTTRSALRPIRFDAEEGRGFSDHLPLLLVLGI